MSFRFAAEISHYRSELAYAGSVPYHAPHAGAMTPTVRTSCTIDPKSGTECCKQPDGSTSCTSSSPALCAPGLWRCSANGPCLNLMAASDNCGRCGNICPTGYGCYQGVCLQNLASGCPASYTPCGGNCCVPGSSCPNGSCVCATPSPNPIACGDCGKKTPTCSSTGTWSYPTYCEGQGNCTAGKTRPCAGLGTQTCSSTTCEWGQCVCPFTMCGEKCINTGSDPSNCGGCNISCPSGQTCCGGVCVTCPSGFLECSGTACVCPAGQSACGPSPGICTNTLWDPNNCGSCGNVCSSQCCQGICTDTSTDSLNCGGCEHQCLTNSAGIQLICQAGACSCPATQLNPNSGNFPDPLESSNNYVFFAGQNSSDPTDCNPIGPLTVSFSAFGDTVAYVGSPGTTASTILEYGGGFSLGFSMQLNAFPMQPNATALATPFTNVQFFLAVGGGFGFYELNLFGGSIVMGVVEFWSCPGAGQPCTEVHSMNSQVLSLPSATIPNGSFLEISLATETGGEVTGVTFTATTPSSPNNPPVFVPIPDSFQVPIVAFSTVIVGPDNSKTSIFASGSSGSLTYAATSGSLCIQSTPSCAGQASAGVTDETSNITYGTIDPGCRGDSCLCCGSSFSQSTSAPSNAPAPPSG